VTLHRLRPDPPPGAAGRSRRVRPHLRQALRRRPRQIAPKQFYDARGSALFDAICELLE
jgi:uncharacterized SAM-dependent methyltransferase